jgi:hypothetical protein
MTSQADLEEYCRDLYVCADQKWDQIRHEFVTGHLAFGILYGPPRLNPPLLIVRTNPGYDEDDDSQTWPSENLFSIYPPPQRDKRRWRLAQELIKYFEHIGQETVLKESVPTNLLFFKSRGMEKNIKDRLGWKNNPLAARQSLEKWCYDEVRKLTVKINPSRILVVGITPYKRLAEDTRPESRGAKRALYRRGTVFNKPATGPIHLTGRARPPLTPEERLQIEQGLARFLAGE